MKKFLLIVGLGLFIFSCEKDNSPSEWECGTYNGKTLYTGPKGGCYYKQQDGEKTYVDRKYCKCLK